MSDDTGVVTTAVADSVVALTTTISDEWVSEFRSFLSELVREVDAAIHDDDPDPVQQSRRRCALIAIGQICPHYMSRGTGAGIVRAILGNAT